LVAWRQQPKVAKRGENRHRPPFLKVTRDTCRNSVNPETYLRDTLAKIADGHTISRIDELMPRSAHYGTFRPAE
jgi:hypothetical protein